MNAVLVSSSCFPEKFVRKCLRAVEEYHKSLPDSTTDSEGRVGIRVAGTFSKHQLQIMAEYYEVMDQLSQVADTIEWMQATSLNRLAIPQGLDEYAELDKGIATKAIQRILLSMYRPSPFGAITNAALLLFRQELWINDDCIMHAMTTLQEELGPSIGIISPTFMGTKDAESKQTIIQKSQPFHERSHFVLLPLHVQGNHWCGAVFDFKASPGTITLYDPQQKKKQIDTCEAIVKELFPDIVEKMEIKHEKRLKQADGVNCGPLVLHFFESSIRGITLEGPTISPALLRYIRPRYLLKSLHV